MKDEDVIFSQVYGSSGNSFHVYVHPKNRIEVHSRNGRGETFDVKVFRQGDVAQYGSFKLKYTGQIVSITAKRVIIKPQFGPGTKRLDFRHFAWRNHDFDLERTMSFSRTSEKSCVRAPRGALQLESQ